MCDFTVVLYCINHCEAMSVVFQGGNIHKHPTRGHNKTEVESVQLGNAYIADMDKCPRGQMLW